jgi:hypothetical protein
MLLRPGAILLAFWHFRNVICKGGRMLDTPAEMDFIAD